MNSSEYESGEFADLIRCSYCGEPIKLYYKRKSAEIYFAHVSNGAKACKDALTKTQIMLKKLQGCDLDHKVPRVK